MDEKWQKMGSTIIDAIILFQIYVIIFVVLLVVIIILVTHYLKMSKQGKENGNIDYKNSRKYILWRICIIIAVALFVVLLAPLLLLI